MEDLPMYRVSSSRLDVRCNRSARAPSRARIRSVLEYTVILLLCAATASAEEQRPSHEKLEVRAIRAYFYYPSEGTFDFSEGMNDGTAALWNVSAGGGAADHQTSTTLVLVDIVGPPIRASRKGTIELVALNDDRELLRSSVPLMFLPQRSDGKTTVPFFVHGTGCGKLRLFTTLDSEGERADRSTAIYFQCGE
jgi:hypothetical protein